MKDISVSIFALSLAIIALCWSAWLTAQTQQPDFPSMTKIERLEIRTADNVTFTLNNLECYIDNQALQDITFALND